MSWVKIEENFERFMKSIGLRCRKCGGKPGPMCGECVSKMYAELMDERIFSDNNPVNLWYGDNEDKGVVIMHCTKCRVKFKGPGLLCILCKERFKTDSFGRFLNPKPCTKCASGITNIYDLYQNGYCKECSQFYKDEFLKCKDCNKPFSPYVYNDYSRGLCFECVHKYIEKKEVVEMRKCDICNTVNLEEVEMCKKCLNTLFKDQDRKETCEFCGGLVTEGNDCLICWDSTVVERLSKRYSDSDKADGNYSILKKSLERTRGLVEGVGKDAPTVVNELGGKQSKVLYRYDLLDPKSMFEMTKVLSEGAEKYGEDNWRKISIEDHLNHMIIHAYAYLAGDKSDEHLSHIMCRAMFAQAVEIQEKEEEEK